MSVSPGLGLPLVRPTIKICWLPTTTAASRPASTGAGDASLPTSIAASRAGVAPAVPAEVPLTPPAATLPLESGDSVEVIAPDPPATPAPPLSPEDGEEPLAEVPQPWPHDRMKAMADIVRRSFT